jgi:ABC-type transport system involved in multi-copper enzyme maturation permease subunit
MRIFIQSWALLVDAYRELNSKKLFWITMVLSCLVVAVFGMFGIDSKGLTFLWFKWPLPVFNSTVFAPGLFYRFAFAQFGVPLWLSWVATILAMISTASIIPDFVASGSIDLLLSKPIGRLRLFMSKYLTGLLFVALQVAVFTGASFLVIGIRGSSWEWRMWLAVPIVVLFFSYLFAVCALVGMLTRSTIAALLATLLMWVTCFILNTSDVVFLRLRVAADISVKDAERVIQTREAAARKMIAEFTEKNLDFPKPKGEESPLDAVSPPLVSARKQLIDAKENQATWKKWSGIAFGVKTVFPKTNETIALLDRKLVSVEELQKLGILREDTATDDEPAEEPDDSKRWRRDRRGDSRADKALNVEMRSRSMGWIIGTSVAFEVFIVGVACIVFVRRDF